MMEFGEKLQMLRKSKGMTQEELAQALYVSRTAVSKWESGRGYPGIDSLKEIASYFSVTIDELLSGEKIISIAEKENRANIRRLCSLVFGITDLLSIVLIVLPLYPKAVDGFVYAVNLMDYTQTSVLNRSVFWIMFIALALTGAATILLTRFQAERRQNAVALGSMLLGSFAVIFLALAGETYAVVTAFLLLLIKGTLALGCVKAGG